MGTAISIAAASLLLGLVSWALTSSHGDDGAAPNSMAGIRTRATTSSPEAWVTAHRAARRPARWVLGVTVPLGLLGIVLAMVSTATPVGTTWAMAVSVAAGCAVVVGLAWTCWVADRAARTVRPAADGSST